MAAFQSKSNRKKKNSSEVKVFTEYLKKPCNENDLSYVIAEQIALMENVCRKCMNDRMSCVLSPPCGDRKHLNLLIAVGAPESSYPKFCYDTYKKNLEKFWKKMKVLVKPVDAHLPLKTFIALISNIKKVKDNYDLSNFKSLEKSIIEHFKKYSKSVESISNEDRIFLSVDGIIYLIDLRKELVTINVETRNILNEKELEDLISLFLKGKKITYSLIPKFKGWYYLKISLPLKNKTEIITFEELLKLHKKKFDYLQLVSMEGKVSLVVDIKTLDFSNEKSITPYVNMRNLFLDLNERIERLGRK
ncbi:MAG: hypothetical protein ACTSUV_04690 [Candidatus Ranarchaeia archaeon]